MLVLGIDTATRRGSVAVVSFDGGDGARGADATQHRLDVLAERFSDGSLQHGETLLGWIDDSLSAAGVALDDLDAIAVSIGPGSFTGLRVGLATAKGLVLGTRTALIGVPTLTALAATTILPPPTLREPTLAAGRCVVCPCLDARRGEVYGALFAVDGGAASIAEAGAVERLLDDVVCSPEALAAAVDAAAERVAGAAIALLGDGVERHAARLREHLGVDALFLPIADYPLRGAAVAALGARALIESGADDPASLAPRYARVSDAERMRAVRLAAGGGVGSRR